MWKFLFNMYITQPWLKDKMKFTNFYSLIFIFSAISVLQIHYILYPEPELSELNKVEGVLMKITDYTGGRYPSLTATVLTINNKKVNIIVSPSKDDISLYQENIGKPIQIWYRRMMVRYSANQIILNGQIIRLYSKDKQSLFLGFLRSIILYIALMMFFYALVKPWVLLWIRKIKS